MENIIIIKDGKENEKNIIMISWYLKENYFNAQRTGRGKEYKNGELVFEAEYLNGERNKKGKQYWNGKLKFECEF